MGTHAPRADVFVARENIAVAIDEGNVDGIGHKAGVDRRALRECHDEWQAVAGNWLPSQHAAQSCGKRLRHHKLRRRPDQSVERPRVGDVGRDRTHMTTPGRQGSIVTTRSCDNCASVPKEMPAMLSELGHGS